MLNRIYFLIFSLMLGYNLTAQTDMGDAKHKDTLIRDNMYYDNTWNVYYNLKASPDTIFKYMYLALRYDPVYECHQLLYRELQGHGSRGLERFPKDYAPQKIKQVRAFCDSINKGLDSITIKALVQIKKNDDGPRMTKPASGHDEKWEKQQKHDSINQLLIAELISKKGKYIGKDIVGVDMEEVTFNVIIHAGITYQEKYLPVIEKAVKESQLWPYTYPELVDKINMQKGIPQIYGTQLIYNAKRDAMELYKVQDKAHIDELRKKYQLGTLSSFLKWHNAYLPLK